MSVLAGNLYETCELTARPNVTYTYDSFGNLANSTGSVTNWFRYTGREFDTETNLNYYRARYDDPLAGRFGNEDPLGFGGGINFYAYVSNNSITFVDLSFGGPSE